MMPDKFDPSTMASEARSVKLIASGRTAQVYALDNETVVKVLRSGFPSALIHAEAEKHQCVEASGVPIPRLLGIGEFGGRTALRFERLYGISMLDRLIQNPHDASGLGRQFATLHARLLRLKVDGLPSMKARLTECFSSTGGTGNVNPEASLKQLSRLPDGDSLCHGDFHPGNVLITDSGPKVIDWIDASIGEAAADIARSLLLIRDAELTGQGIPAVGTRSRLALLEFRRGYHEWVLEELGMKPPEIEAWQDVLTAVRRLEIP